MTVTSSYGMLFSQLDDRFRPNHKKFCLQSNEYAYLGKVYCSSGVYQFKLYCYECGGRGGSIAHNYLQHIDQSKIPLLNDYTENAPLCERCGAEGTEIHHWAPKHLFGAWESTQWPTSHLCRRCHAEWHNRVTPNM
jgi:ribosomal protein L40E